MIVATSAFLPPILPVVVILLSTRSKVSCRQEQDDGRNRYGPFICRSEQTPFEIAIGQGKYKRDTRTPCDPTSGLKREIPQTTRSKLELHGVTPSRDHDCFLIETGQSRRDLFRV